MNKDKIFEYIKSFGLIIKKTVDHKNGDTTIRFGKKDIVKESTEELILKELQNIRDNLSEHIQEFEEYKIETNKRFDTIDADIKDIETDVAAIKRI